MNNNMHNIPINKNNVQSHVFVFSTNNGFPNQNQVYFNNMNNQNPFFMQNLNQQNFNMIQQNYNEMFKMYEQNFKNMQNQRNNPQKFNFQQPQIMFTQQHFISTTTQNVNNNVNNNNQEEDKLSDISGEISNNLYDPKRIYKAITDTRTKYPQGLSWNNNDQYSWGRNVASGLGYSSFNGRGCLAFSMIASDAAFGNIPAYEFTDKNKIRVGD